jgi:hypothetical protein
MVVAEEAAEPLVADDLSAVLSERVVGRDQVVAERRRLRSRGPALGDRRGSCG